jgi:hypothetical protein
VQQEHDRRIVEHEWTFTTCGEKYSDELKDLVRRLLDRDQHKRLGVNGDADEVLKHPAFNDHSIIEEIGNRSFPDVQLKPEIYDLNQDFDAFKHKQMINRELNAYTD